MEGMRLAAALVASCAAGAAAAAGEAHWYTQIANDVVFGTDRWYTSGVRIAREQDGAEWGLVHDVFTPDGKHWYPGKDDRVPAARLLASRAWHDRGPALLQTIEIAVGVTGPMALGRQVTSAIHRLVPAPHVDWERQGHNAVDANAAITRTQSIGPGILKVHYGATLGTQVAFAHAGFELRAGDATVSSSLLRYVPTPSYSAGGEHRWSAYLGMSARGVARNELISRNYDPFGSDITYRPFVSRVALGAAWLARWGTLTLEAAQDSKEFDAQTAPDRFGLVSIQVPF